MSSTTTHNLNLRSGGSTGSSVITVMPKGASVTITGAPVNGWYPVSYNGKTGWASAKYFTPLTSPPVTPPTTTPEPAPIPHVQSGSNPFLSTESTYGGTQNWYDTPLVKQTMSPKAFGGEWERYITEQGYGGNNRQAGIARDLASRAATGFEAASLQNPNLSNRDYFQALGPNFIRDQLAGMTGKQRGEDWGAYSPRVRWVTR
jgi:hypothetical protein